MIRKSTLFIIISLSFCLSLKDLKAQWSHAFINSNSDKNYSFTVDNSRIYVNAGQFGLYVSYDTAKTWKRLNLNDNVVQSTVDDSVIIVNEASGFFYLSTDNGNTWKKINSIPTYAVVNNIIIYNHEIYIYSGAYVYIYSESGELINTVPGYFSYLDITGLAVGNDSLLVTTQLYNEKDQGCLFIYLINEKSIQRTSLNNIDIASLLKQNFEIIVKTTDSLIYSSSDNGITWNVLNLKHVSNIALNNNTLLVNTFNLNEDKLLYSSDFGNTFNEIPLISIPSKITDIGMMGNNFMIGTKNNGIYISNNYGKSWKNVSLQFNYNSVSSLKASTGSLVALAADSLILSSVDNGSTWNEFSDGFPVNEYNTKFITSDDSIVYAVNIFNKIYYYNEGLKTWIYIDSIPKLPENFGSLAIDKNIIVANMGYNVQIKINNNPFSLFKVPFDPYTYYNIYMNLPIIMFYAPNGSFYITNDTGRTWQFLINTVLNFNTTYCFKYRNGIYYAGTNNGLYQSSDNLKTWTKNGVIGNVYNVEFYKNYILVLSDYNNISNPYYDIPAPSQVFFSDDNGKHFYPLPVINIPGVDVNADNHINDILVNEDELIVAANNFGIWKYPLNSFTKTPAILTYKDSITICAGDSFRFNIHSLKGYSVDWQEMSFEGNSYKDQNSHDSVYYANNTGIYRVVITDNSGNSFYSKPVSIFLRPQAYAHITSGNGMILCKGDSMSLFADTLRYVSAYIWEKNGNIIKGATNSTLNANSPGYYNLLVSDSCGSSASNSFFLYNDSLTPFLIDYIGKAITCKGVPLLLYPYFKNNPVDEGFETGNLKKYPWINKDTNKWKISSDTVYQGKYSLSVTIINTPASLQDSYTLCNSGLSVTLDYPIADTISFYVNTNLFDNWFDQNLSFYINNVLKQFWSGINGWQKVSFPVQPGINTFLWEYTNQDLNNLYNYNCARLDNITFRNYSKWDYQWYKDGVEINGATFPDYAATDKGYYSLYVKDKCYSLMVGSLPVETFPPPDTSVTLLIDTTNICRKGSVTMNAVNNSSYKYTWYWNGNPLNNSGSDKSDYYADNSGLYHVSITDSNNCSLSSGDKSVAIKPKINTNIDFTGGQQYCQNVPKLLSASADTGLTFQWKFDDAIIPEATNSYYITLESGYYSVQISDNINCKEVSDSVLVKTHPSSATLYFFGDSDLCQNPTKDCWLCSNMNFIDGFEKEYNSLNPSPWSSDGGNESYPWYVTSGEAHTGNFSMTNGRMYDDYSELDLYVTLPEDDSVSFYFKTGYDLDYKFNAWSSNNYLTIPIPANTDWTKESVFLKAGDYALFWSLSGFSGGGDYYIDDVKIGNLINPVYQWYNNGHSISGQSNYTYDARDTGDYSVSVTDECGTIFSRKLRLFDSCYYNTATLIEIDSSDSKCTTGAKIMKIEGAKGYIFTWFFNDILLPEDTTNQIYADESGSYDFCATNPKGGGSCWFGFPVDIVPATLYTAKITSMYPFICDDVGAVLTANTGDSLKYQWYRDGLNIKGATNSALEIFDTEIYQVSVDFDGQCSDMSNAFSLWSKLSPDKPVISDNSPAICTQDSVKLGYQPPFYDGFESGMLDYKGSKWINDLNYPWTVVSYKPYKGKYCLMSGMVFPYTPAQVQISVVLQKADSLFFYFLISGTDNYLNLFVNGFQTISFNSTDYNFKTGQWIKASCYLYAGENNLTWSFYHNTWAFDPVNFACLDEINIGFNDDITYQWLKNGDNIPGATDSYYYAFPTGVYNLLVSNECSQSISDSVNVGVSTSANISPVNTVKICGDSIVDIIANYSPGLTYQWQKNSENIQNATSSIYQTATSGDYRVIESNLIGCKDTSEFMTLAEYPNPVININADTTLCAGQSYTITASANSAVSYLWSTGQTSKSITIDSSNVGFGYKKFSVTVTNIEGCSTISKDAVLFADCTNINNFQFSIVNFQLFPNPSDGIFTINCSENPNTTNATAPVSLEIYNNLGKKINYPFSFIHFPLTIDLGNFPKGLYLIKLNNEKGSFTCKIEIL